MLPILKSVVDEGHKTAETSLKNGMSIQYAKEFYAQGVQVVVRFFVVLQGKMILEDAWGNKLF